MSTYKAGMGGSADVTTWNYDSERGWMTSKVYADSTTNSYEYFSNGSLKKRTWARGVYAEYSYDNGGSLTNVNYSDSTDDISHVRDRLGRASTVTDSAGTWTNTYVSDGSLGQVTLPQLAGGVLDYEQDTYGRVTNVAVKISGATVHHTAYSFDNAGRISTVSDGSRTVTYAYGQDGITATNLSFGGPMNVSKVFDGLNRLTQISSAPSASSAVSFSYQYNSANQRVTNVLADSSYWLYSYDSLGQVTSGKKFFSDGDPVGGCQFEYAHDQIGNRETTKNFRGASSITATYTANNVNQYTQRTVPGEIFVTGTAITNSTVAIREGTNNSSLASRHGTYFWTALDADNSSALFSTTNVQIRAYTGGVVRLEVREDIIAKTPETITHDQDGNCTSDGLFTNQWNAANRLIQVESKSSVPDAFKFRVDYKYDHQGRMFERIVRSGYSGGSYSATNTHTFVWDGMNMIVEVIASASSTETNFYLYGLDLSGTLQGAGGVGGLLIVTLNSTNNYFYFVKSMFLRYCV